MSLFLCVSLISSRRYCQKLKKGEWLCWWGCLWGVTQVAEIQYYISFTTKLLGHNWNYMPYILIPSSAKRITTQILVAAKLNGRKYFFWRGFVCQISVPAKNYLFKTSNWSTRINCENCSRLRMKILKRC